MASPETNSNSNSTQNASTSPPPSNETPPPPQQSSPPPQQSPPPKEQPSPPPASSPPPPSPKQEASPPPGPPPSPPPNASPPPKALPPPLPDVSPPPPIALPPPKTPAPTATPSPPPPNASPPPPPTALEPKPLSPTPPMGLITPPPKDAIVSPPQAPESPSPPSLPPVATPSPPMINPPPPSSLEHNTGDSAHKGGIGTTEIIIIAGTAGALLLILVAALLCVICMQRRKRKPQKWAPGMQYYRDPSRTPNGNNYYEQHWYGPPSMEHGQNLNGPPHPPPGYRGLPGGGWAPSPLQMLSSGEMSSNFSDPHSAGNLPSPSLALGFNKSSFTYDELAAATDRFSQANLLGQGGFGFVHKGVFPNGKVVAVKSLKSGSGQGEREFQAEVDIISRVHHRHLVSLDGYCIAGAQRMLVYQFVPNGNLEQHLHAKYQGVTLDWSKRLTIGIGAARGLAYLHEDCHPRIIHRDIKAANILLDNNYEAMVADFGLAKLTTDNITHVSTRVMGTFGYLAPEYASSGKLTEKSDVFSFGVMLLELITGRRPVDTSNKYMDDSLVDWARPLLTGALADENYDELVDPSLENNYNPEELKRMIACASVSIRHSAKRRPKMSQIVRALEGNVSLEDLNEVKQSSHSSSGSILSSEYNTRAYNEDLKQFQKLALESSVGGDPNYTSTYGLNPSSSSEDLSSREMK